MTGIRVQVDVHEGCAVLHDQRLQLSGLCQVCAEGGHAEVWRQEWVGGVRPGNWEVDMQEAEALGSG